MLPDLTFQGYLLFADDLVGNNHQLIFAFCKTFSLAVREVV